MDDVQRVPPYTLERGFQLVSYTTPGKRDEPFVVVLEHLPDQYCPVCSVNHPVRSLSPRRIHDVPYDGHPVVLSVVEGQWRCPTRQEQYWLRYDVDRLRCTDALRAYITRQRGRVTVRDLARETGLSPAKIVRLTKHAEAQRVPSTPVERVKHLGLDDIYMQGGQHLIAVDLDTGRVLALQRAGNITQGRAGQIDVDIFVFGLPEADVVALDLHPVQYQAARRRWPEAVLVVDKRHLLAIIDREVLAQAARVILDWHEEDDQNLSAQRIISKFGSAAYPYLALRTLVLRRRHSLTAADHVAWSMIRREKGQEAQLLWEMYSWREALYDVYDRDRRDPAALTAWLTALTQWHTRRFNTEAGSYSQPLGRIRWALETYPEACAAYLTTGVTNAVTEKANARVRRVLRQGHRYDPQALVNLVNREDDAELPTGAATYMVLQTSVPGKRRKRKLRLEKGNLLQQPHPVREDDASLPPPAAPSQGKQQVVLHTVPHVAARHLPIQHPDTGLPQPVWIWLHSAVAPARRGSPRWVSHIANLAPEGLSPQWAVLNAGNVTDRKGIRVAADSVNLWRTTVLYHYALQQAHEFAATMRDLLGDGWDIHDLWCRNTVLCDQLQSTLLTLSGARFLSPTERDLGVLQMIQQGHSIEVRDVDAIRAILDCWCSAALSVDTGRAVDRLRQIRPQLSALSQSQLHALIPEIRWQLGAEMLVRQQLLPPELTPTRVDRALHFQVLWEAWQKIKNS